MPAQWLIGYGVTGIRRKGFVAMPRVGNNFCANDRLEDAIK
jgi:hypothetical protein